jgi:large conductance mechanosensitive channel
MSLIKEFREFAVKGNAVDMAVGIIIGAAFGKIITSLVNDVIMPPVGLLLGGTDFNKLQIVLKNAVLEPVTNKVLTPEVALRYGAFINTMLDFLIVAFCLFMVIKVMNHARKSVTKPDAPK